MDPSEVDLEEFEGLDYESPFPECRILTGWDVAGLIRFDMSKERAALLAKRISRDVEGHSTDEHFHFLIHLDRRAYQEFSLGTIRVLRMGGPDKIGAKQVVVDPDPAVSVGVLYNASQLEDLAEKTSKMLRRAGSNSAFAIQISSSKNGAQMLVQQLVAAVKGAENPLDHVEPGEVDP